MKEICRAKISPILSQSQLTHISKRDRNRWIIFRLMTVIHFEVSVREGKGILFFFFCYAKIYHVCTPEICVCTIELLMFPDGTSCVIGGACCVLNLEQQQIFRRTFYEFIVLFHADRYFETVNTLFFKPLQFNQYLLAKYQMFPKNSAIVYKNTITIDV